ncbi:hypothetical protein E2C01_060250 [Portunus trituberculatus]|uniref:Uncharacterized protein n=1 Tax=Portunus trituberculatus TaxID=210409 RepID=A0A5B7H879_PORTR|nr:hypothetical protein [Portunus trituberculatus]
MRGSSCLAPLQGGVSVFLLAVHQLRYCLAAGQVKLLSPVPTLKAALPGWCLGAVHVRLLDVARWHHEEGGRSSHGPVLQASWCSCSLFIFPGGGGAVALVVVVVVLVVQYQACCGRDFLLQTAYSPQSYTRGWGLGRGQVAPSAGHLFTPSRLGGSEE